jgi:hypothetical protein
MNPYYQNVYNNKLINQFNSHLNQPKQNAFLNNPMINNNPNFSLRDPQFYNKIQMAKIEQIKRAKNINDLGMDKKELSEYIIDPIKINKTERGDIEKKLHETEHMYLVPTTGTKFEDQSNAYLKELWKTRTNQPYKNIIKKEAFDKDYKKYYNDNIFNKNINNRDELIVHKVIKNIDADEDLLEADFLLVQEILEKHNNELKSIYSVSNENKYKREFEYAQKYRYRLEYNPKDSEELKDFYKKEQKKINKENKMLDQIIDMLVEQDDLSKEEINKLNEELHKEKTKDFKYVEDELRDELGDDYDDIMDAIEVSQRKENKRDKRDREIINDEIIEEKKPRIKTKTIEAKTPRKKITVKTSLINQETKQDETANAENDELKEFYKNRKK